MVKKYDVIAVGAALYITWWNTEKFWVVMRLWKGFEADELLDLDDEKFLSEQVGWLEKIQDFVFIGLLIFDLKIQG